MDLRHLGAIREGLAVAGNAGPVGVDHHGIGEDHSEQLFAVTDSNSLPAFVSPELREREPIRHLHSVLVLRREGHAAQGGEGYRNDRNRPNVFTLRRQCPFIACGSPMRI